MCVIWILLLSHILSSWFEIFWLVQGSSSVSSCPHPHPPHKLLMTMFFCISLGCLNAVYSFDVAGGRGWKRCRETRTPCFIELNTIVVCRNRNQLRTVSSTMDIRKSMKITWVCAIFVESFSQRAMFSGMCRKFLSFSILIYFSLQNYCKRRLVWFCAV